MNDEHFVLRQEVYRALGVYHEAAGLFWGALTPGHGPIDPAHLVAVRTTAAELDIAITALRAFLGQLAPSERVEQENMRMARIQELLQYELALLPDEDVGR